MSSHYEPDHAADLAEMHKQARAALQHEFVVFDTETTGAPRVAGLGGMGEQCERCGCSSFVGTPGRPFGVASKSWDWALALVNEIYDDLGDDEKAANFTIRAALESEVTK